MDQCTKCKSEPADRGMSWGPSCDLAHVNQVRQGHGLPPLTAADYDERFPTLLKGHPMPREPIVTENAIKGFFGEYRFLSNFHLAPVVYDNDVYPSTEHAFQAAKFEKKDRLLFVLPFVGQPSPANTISCREAKTLGGKATIDRATWEAKKVGVMYEVVMGKFLGHPELRAKLMATEWKKLYELNDWGDRFWGVEMEGDKEVGFNMLGTVLEAVRARMQDLNFAVKDLADVRRVRGIQHGERP